MNLYQVLSGALKLLGVHGPVRMVAHSYGTFLASLFVQRYPERIEALTLIDPVCMLIFDGESLPECLMVRALLNALRGTGLLADVLCEELTKG